MAFGGLLRGGQQRGGYRVLGVGRDKRSLLKAAKPFEATVDHHETWRGVDKVARTFHYDALLIDGKSDERAIQGVVAVGKRMKVPTLLVGEPKRSGDRLQALLNGADAVVAARSEREFELWRPAIDRDALRERLRRALPDYEEEAVEELLAAMREHTRRVRGRRLQPTALVRYAVKGATLVPSARSREGQRVVQEAARAVESAIADTGPAMPETLYWNTRFDDPDVLGRRPHRVLAGAKYRVETALETGPKGADSPFVDADEVVGKTVRFHVHGTGLALYPKRARTPRASFVSDPMECSETGTALLSFRVAVTAELGALATLELELVADGASVALREITLGVEDSRPRSPRRAATGETGSPIAPGIITLAPPEPLRLHLYKGGPAELSHGVTVVASSPAAPPPEATAWMFGAKYAELRRLSAAHPPADESDPASFRLADPDGALAALAETGQSLHESLFQNASGGQLPDRNLEAMADVIRSLGRGRDQPTGVLQVRAAGYGVPWGLLYDGRLDPPELSGFWGYRFDVERVQAGVYRDPRRQGRPVLHAAVGPSVPSGADHLAYVGEFARTVSDEHLAVVDQASDDEDGLLDWAGSGDPADVLYLFCHAQPARWVDGSGGLQGPQDPLASRFGFGVDPPGAQGGVRLTDLRKRCDGERRSNPLVIANACGSGSLDPHNGAPFVDFFLQRWSCHAFVGTDWPVNARFADRFGRLVLDRLLHHRDSIEDAMRYAADTAFEQGNPFPVLYGMYGPMNIRFT